MGHKTEKDGETLVKSYAKSYELLKGGKVSDLMTGDEHMLKDLWADKPCIINVVRRPGCALCREHGLLLQKKIGERCKELGINLVATCKERIEAETFIKEYWSPYPLFMDIDWTCFRALGEGKAIKGSIWELAKPSFYKRFYEAKKSAKNVLGRGNFILGGLFVVGKGDVGLLYRHVAKGMGTKMDIEAIFNMLDDVAKATPDNFSQIQKKIAAKYPD